MTEWRFAEKSIEETTVKKSKWPFDRGHLYIKVIKYPLKFE